MAVLDIALEQMNAEELLAEMVKPQTSELLKARIRERLVELYDGLVSDVTRRYRYRGEPVEDLRQAAYVGLMKAVNGYDAELGHEFRGYAMITMIGEVKRHFRDRTWAIRVPRVYQERRIELNKATSELTQTLGHSPTVAELSAKMGISEEEVLLTLEASTAYSALSLDAPVGDGEDAVFGDFVAGDEPLPEETVELNLRSEALRHALASLPQREREVVVMRYGLTGAEPQTLEEIGRRLGLTRERVRQIELESLRRLASLREMQSVDVI